MNAWCEKTAVPFDDAAFSGPDDTELHSQETLADDEWDLSHAVAITAAPK